MRSTVVMYADNHIQDIVVKRNTSSSRKRSRDGVRRHITPAKKRSSVTSDMTDSKDTDLVSGSCIQ